MEAGSVRASDASDHDPGARFCGVKRSGIGREECLAEMRAHTRPRTITIVAGQ